MKVLILSEELIKACSATKDALQISSRHLHKAYGIKERWQTYLGLQLLRSPAGDSPSLLRASIPRSSTTSLLLRVLYVY